MSPVPSHLNSLMHPENSQPPTQKTDWPEKLYLNSDNIGPDQWLFTEEELRRCINDLKNCNKGEDWQALTFEDSIEETFTLSRYGGYPESYPFSSVKTWAYYDSQDHPSTFGIKVWDINKDCWESSDKACKTGAGIFEHLSEGKL